VIQQSLQEPLVVFIEVYTAMKNIRGYIEHIREQHKPENRLDDLLFSEVKNNNLDGCKKLINAGANVNALDSRIFSPLHWAAIKGYADIAKLLIDAGANVDIKNTYVDSAPLTLAARNGHTDVVKLLIDAGADVDVKIKRQLVPLYWAAVGDHADIVKLLIDANANMNKGDEDGITALHGAAHFGKTNIAKILIDSGALLDLTDADNWTAFDFAIDNDNLDIAKLLILAGANIDLKAQFGTFKRFSDFFGGDVKWIPLDLIPPKWRESAKFTGTFGGFY
jgi:ankyrin repeat protein